MRKYKLTDLQKQLLKYLFIGVDNEMERKLPTIINDLSMYEICFLLGNQLQEKYKDKLKDIEII